jgi:hypothetical protein
MSGARYTQRAADQDQAAQRVASEHQETFQAVPGEAEADAVRDAFLQRAATDSVGMSSMLSQAGDSTRARALSRMQQEQGNSVVQRLVGESRGSHGSMVGLSQDQMVGEVLQRKGSGSPLPDQTQSEMGQFFGADLGGVRVHSDGESEALNRELSSQAFTVGSDIFMGEGKYDPSSTEGQGLLAHELTHVGQQGGFTGSSVQRHEDEMAIQREGELEEEEEMAT